MVNPDILVKLRWVIFFVLGLCLMVSPALAEVTPAVPEEYHGGMKTTEKYHNRQIPLSAGKSQVELPAETLFPDYYSTDLFFNGGEFDFKVKGFKEEPRLARQKSYSSIHKKKKEGLSQRGRIKLDTKYFKGLFSDTGYALTSPWRWNNSDWATASLVAGVTGVFFMLDDEIKSEFQDNRSSTTNDMSDLFEPFGNGTYSFPALAGLYLYGRFGENEKMERTALLAAESFLVTGLFTTVLK